MLQTREQLSSFSFEPKKEGNFVEFSCSYEFEIIFSFGHGTNQCFTCNVPYIAASIVRFDLAKSPIKIRVN